MKNSWKRVIAGTLAVLVLAGTVPADLGINGLFGGKSTSITAYADNTGTLLTTITATGKEQAGYSTANVATVSFRNLPNYSSSYNDNWGWWGYGWTATVTPVEGYTITKCVFYDDEDRKATDSEAPFVVETEKEDKTPKVNGVPILAYTSKGIKKIEVYGYATPQGNNSPTAASGLTCNGSAQKLLAENGTGEASEGAEMMYALAAPGYDPTKKSATAIIQPDSYQYVYANQIKKGTVYKSTSFDNRIVFVMMGETLIYQNDDQKDVFDSGQDRIFYYEEYAYKYYLADHANASNDRYLPEGCDALYVSEVTGDSFTVIPVNSAEYAVQPEVTWSATPPTATDAGTYTVYYKVEGNDNYNSVDITPVTATIAKDTLKKGAELTGGVDYTAPTVKTATGLDYLYFNDKDQALIKEGSLRENINPDNAGENDKVKMEYAAVPKAQDVTVIERNSSTALSINEVEVGNVYKPTNYLGVYFPEGYSFIYDNVTHTNTWVNFYLSPNGKYYIQYGTGDDTALGTGFDALKVTAIDKTAKTITVEAVNADTAYNEAIANYTWSTEVPTKKEAGEYNVYYRIKGGANYNDVAPTKIGTAKIDYKPISLTLSNLGNGESNNEKVKVAEYDEANKKETEVTATEGKYILKASKTYNIYTQKSISGDSEEKYGLSRKTLKTGDYKYVYTITLPEVPDAEDYKNDAFTLSHTNDYHGKVLDSDQTKLYVADGGVNVTDDTTLAATLAGKNTYYYGDTPVVGDVDIRMTNLVKVKDIYLADSTDAKVDLTSANVKYGKYNLTAIMTIDNDGDNNFETTTGQLTETLRREVEFAPRPMSENTYYLKGADNQLTKLAVKYAKAKAAGTGSGSGSGTGIPVGISGGTPVETPIGNTETELDLTNLVATATDEYKYPVVVVPENTYTYNSEDQKPEIVVKNPNLNKSTENEQGTALVIKSETADGEYTSAVTAHKDAGTYSEKITAVPDITGNNVTKQANYTGDVTVVWTIKKATVAYCTLLYATVHFVSPGYAFLEPISIIYCHLLSVTVPLCTSFCNRQAEPCSTALPILAVPQSVLCPTWAGRSANIADSHIHQGRSFLLFRLCS